MDCLWLDIAYVNNDIDTCNKAPDKWNYPIIYCFKLHWSVIEVIKYHQSCKGVILCTRIHSHLCKYVELEDKDYGSPKSS